MGAQASQAIGQAFDNPLTPETRNPALQLISHAAVGCAVGAIATGNCGSAAAAQFAGEAAALAYRSTIIDDINTLAHDPNISEEQAFAKVREWQQNGVNIARLTGALAAAIAGGDAADVNAGANAATEAAENNVAPVLLLLLVAASASYTAVDVANVYVTEGPEAALEQLAINGAVTIVTGVGGAVVYKVGGKLISNADDAYHAWKATQPATSSAGLVDNINWTKFLKDNAKTTNVLGEIDPKNIRFTQDSISPSFKNGQGLVDDLIVGLKNGSIKPEDIPEIRIFEVDGKLFSLDNRRLQAFKEAGIPIKVKPATQSEIVNESFKFTTKNGGVSVIRK